MSSTGLDALADDHGRLAVLAMDQRGTLRKMLTGAGKSAEDEDLRAFKVDVVSALSPLATGVLLDPEFGVPAVQAAGALHPGTGLLVAAEPATKDTWNGEYRTVLDPERNAAWVKAQGGDGLKFLVYWDPDRAAVDGEPDLAAEAMARVGEVVADCAAQGVPSIIEPLVSFAPTAPKPSVEAKVESVIRSAARLATLNPSLLKLEWPGSAEGCRRVTEDLGPVPWTLLSAGVEYDAFVDRTRIALDAGACGIIAGRAIWGEAVTLDGDARRAFLAEVAVPRLKGLLDVLAEHGRSWRAVTA